MNATTKSACLAALLAAFALSAGADPLPAEQRQGAVAFRSGGIGEDEAAAMLAAARDYPLALEFVARSGEDRGGWLADVDVAIRDGRGNEVLHTRANGPVLLARLPAGRYTVTAQNGEAQRTQRVDVPAHGTRRVVLGW